MAKRWLICGHDQQRIARLERQLGVSPVVAQLLLSRGVDDPHAARIFLDPKLTDLREPDELPGLTDAADRLLQAIHDGRRIVVYGDYDADGMTATAILYGCLRALGGDVGYHIPSRLEDGYGLNDDALRSLAERETHLVVTVDCGIASVEEAALARQLGLELIVTDHHEFGQRLPEAAAIVHPRLPGTDYPFPGLCGAGVAFKLAWALCQRAANAKKVGQRLRDFLLHALGLAAIGTIADVVPLVDENRVLVAHGLNMLMQLPGPGLAALMKLTGLSGQSRLASEDVAFTLAPRLNAAGRLGQAQLGVELLVTESAERAEALAQYIHQLNATRETIERSIYLEANKQIKQLYDPESDPALVLAGRGWHPGVIGIVAGRLAEKYHRPTVLIALDQLASKPATGSARSAGGINLHEALQACGEHLLACGGHAAAAGLRILEEQIEAFRTEFCEVVAGQWAESDRVAQLRIDAEAPLSQMTLETVEQIERLAPFGCGNPRPVLCASAARIAGPPRAMGAGERHLALKFSQYGTTLRAVAFGKPEWREPLSSVDQPLDIAYRPVINQFRGRRNVELHLVDWRPAEAAVDSPR